MMTHKAQVEFAEAWLRARNIPYFKVQAFQLKIGPVNFYPTTGVIFLDNEARKHHHTGLAALEKVLRAEGLFREPTQPPAILAGTMSPNKSLAAGRLRKPKQRVHLKVPFPEKDGAKSLGARWDPEARHWYIPAGVDPIPLLTRWPAVADVQGPRSADYGRGALSPSAAEKTERSLDAGRPGRNPRRSKRHPIVPEDSAGAPSQDHDYGAPIYRPKQQRQRAVPASQRPQVLTISLPDELFDVHEQPAVTLALDELGFLESLGCVADARPAPIHFPWGAEIEDDPAQEDAFA